MKTHLPANGQARQQGTKKAGFVAIGLSFLVGFHDHQWLLDNIAVCSQMFSATSVDTELVVVLQ